MEYSSARKYQQMLRAFERLKQIGTDHGSHISNTDAPDAAEDFFNQCYHLKDWLKKEHPDLATTIEQHISNTPCLAIAADYCNSLKHAGLTRATPRSGQHIENRNVHIKMDFGRGGPITSSSASVTLGDQQRDVLDLATQCVDAWNSFLKDSGLDLQ